MFIAHESFDDRLPSAGLWKGFSPPETMGRDGKVWTTPSGNPAFGFFDDLMVFEATTIYGPYALYAGTGCSVAQIACTATEKGLVQLTLDGNAAADEAQLSWGRGVTAPFKLDKRDLVFEARLSVSATTAAKWSMGVGLGEVGMQATDSFFIDTTYVLADKNFLGFVKLSAAATKWDGCYRADGQAVQNGSTKTKLKDIATLTATEYIKLGFRYRAHPRMVEWYVDGKLAGTGAAPARITASECNAATFPGDVLLAPVIGVKDAAGNAEVNIKLDWWGCAQYL